MRWGILLAAACLAACSDQDRATFDVQLTPGTTRVEVFVASESACNDCELQPQFVTTLLQGMRFERDPDPLLAIEANGDHAAFAIAPNEYSDKVRSIVVIGYDADKAISGAALIRDIHTNQQPQLYRVTLTAVTAEPLAKTAPMTGSQRAQVWGSEEVHGKCVGLERWHESQLEDRVFIVPADDPDCDGVLADAECNPYAYLSSSSSDAGAINCVTDSVSVNSLRPCQFGSAMCVDGQSQGVCEAKAICVPASLCEDTTICPAGSERECLLEKLDRTLASARVVCEIPFEPDPGSGVLRTCNGERAAATIDGLPSLFSNPANPLTGVGVIGRDAFNTGFTFTPSVQVEGGTLTVALEATAANQVKVTWEGGYTSSDPEAVILGMKLSMASRDIMLPLQVVQNSCEANIAARCKLELDADSNGTADTIVACAK